jgi:hypothetical protein
MEATLVSRVEKIITRKKIFLKKWLSKWNELSSNITTLLILKKQKNFLKEKFLFQKQK